MDIRFICLITGVMGIVCLLFALLALHMPLLILSIPLLITGLVTLIMIRKQGVANSNIKN